MLPATTPGIEAVRFASADSVEKFTDGAAPQRTLVSRRAALEENFFLGLRLNRGISLRAIATTFGEGVVENVQSVIAEFTASGLMERRGDLLSLTSRGRLLSNEVFQRFILSEEAVR
jgi:oxygen-independent coproporphyrinogen-3 oxidase